MGTMLRNRTKCIAFFAVGGFLIIFIEISAAQHLCKAHMSSKGGIGGLLDGKGLRWCVVLGEHGHRKGKHGPVIPGQPTIIRIFLPNDSLGVGMGYAQNQMQQMQQVQQVQQMQQMPVGVVVPMEMEAIKF